jgi:hypothetical protein
MDDASQSIQAHLDGVTPEKRRRDAQRLLELMSRVTGETPRLWGSIVGFGQYHYKYESGRQGDAPAAAFAPRKAAATIYLPDGISRYDEQLRQLGPHTTGGGMSLHQGSGQDRHLYPRKRRGRVVPNCYGGTYGLRARDGAATPPDE